MGWGSSILSRPRCGAQPLGMAIKRGILRVKGGSKRGKEGENDVENSGLDITPGMKAAKCVQRRWKLHRLGLRGLKGSAVCAHKHQFSTFRC